MQSEKTKIKKGFAIVNIIMGVILTGSGLTSLEEKGVPSGLLIFIGLLLLVVGWIALNTRKRAMREEADATEGVVKVVKITNTVCFVISVLILSAVIILPVLASLGIFD